MRGFERPLQIKVMWYNIRMKGMRRFRDKCWSRCRSRRVAGRKMRIFDTLKCCTEAEGRDYTANELNQYTAIDSFEPTYDLDGNQTKILTSTGEWVVEYNAENRPIRWTQGNIEIEMAYDRMGRRISYHETRNGANYINAKFVYNGYLCIQRLYGSSNGVYQSFVWDPTEPVATRPLCMQVPSWGATTFYMHDGNKNVSDLIYYALANGIAAHYDYAPFGAVTRTARDTRMTQHTFIAENPFRFSSEYHDNTLGLVYYNYRHYNPKDGRWCRRDPIEEDGGLNLYTLCHNDSSSKTDVKGLICYIYTWGSPIGHSAIQCQNGLYISKFPGKGNNKNVSILDSKTVWRTLSDDIKEYGSNYTVTSTECLNEDAMQAWFDSQKSTDRYTFGTSDCTDIVTGALQMGLNQERPDASSCPQPSLCERLLGGEAIVVDLLENKNFTPPKAVEDMVKKLNAGKCNRYMCTIEYRIANRLCQE